MRYPSVIFKMHTSPQRVDIKAPLHTCAHEGLIHQRQVFMCRSTFSLDLTRPSIAWKGPAYFLCILKNRLRRTEGKEELGRQKVKVKKKRKGGVVFFFLLPNKWLTKFTPLQIHSCPFFERKGQLWSPRALWNDLRNEREGWVGGAVRGGDRYRNSHTSLPVEGRHHRCGRKKRKEGGSWSFQTIAEELGVVVRRLWWRWTVCGNQWCGRCQFPHSKKKQHTWSSPFSFLMHPCCL